MLDAEARPAANREPVTGPSVAVIILNWNGKQDTLECLESVARLDYPNVEVVVVDNGSIDDSVTAIRTAFPDLTLIATGANLGYAGGNNVGMRYAMDHAADYVLLLNNDTVVDPGLVKELTRTAEALGADAILAPQIYFHSEPDTIWYAGGHVIPKTGRTYHEDFRAPARAGHHQGIVETDYASGCALFVSTRLLARVGLFDERFFLLYEETDLCYRARAIGARSYVVASAKVWHKVSTSFGGALSPSYMYFWSRNRLLWCEKHLSLPRLLRAWVHVARVLFDGLRPPAFRLNAPAGPFGRRVRTAVAAYRAALATQYGNPVLRAQICGIRDYVLRRFGNRPSSRLPAG